MDVEKVPDVSWFYDVLISFLQAQAATALVSTSSDELDCRKVTCVKSREQNRHKFTLTSSIQLCAAAMDHARKVSVAFAFVDKSLRADPPCVETDCCPKWGEVLSRTRQKYLSKR